MIEPDYHGSINGHHTMMFAFFVQRVISRHKLQSGLSLRNVENLKLAKTISIKNVLKKPDKAFIFKKRSPSLYLVILSCLEAEQKPEIHWVNLTAFYQSLGNGSNLITLRLFIELLRENNWPIKRDKNNKLHLSVIGMKATTVNK